MIWKYRRKTPVFQCCFILISLWMTVNMSFHWNTIFSPVRLVKIEMSGATPNCPGCGQTHSYTWLVGMQICVIHLPAHTHTHTHSELAVLFWECALKIHSAAGRLWTVPRRPASWGLCPTLLSSLSVTQTWWKCQSLSCVRPLDCTLPGSSVHGILQGGILEWVAIPSSRGSSQPRDQT